MAEVRTRIAVFISGRGSNMAALLYASRLPDSAFEIALVAANDPAAPGLALAGAEDVPTFALSHRGMTRADHDSAMETAAQEAGADLIALAGYMRILTPEFVARWEGRMLNIHPSLLPLYPGLDTHARAIAAGDAQAGATVHLVTEELDAGETLGRAVVAVAKGDTPATLAARVQYAEHQLYPHTLARYLARAEDAGQLIDRVRALALALPSTRERESHGSAGWRVGPEKTGKYFAYFLDRHHGSPHVGMLVKTSAQDELLDLVDAQPETYFKPAYYGASGWIGLILNRPDMDWDHAGDWLARSWRQVAPKRLAAQYDAIV